MIKYIIIVALIITNTYGQVGEIIPLNPPIETEIQNGTYIQDMYFDFAPYVGTWEGNWTTGSNNKIFRLKIEKITRHLISHPNGHYYYQDLIIGKYTITETVSGNIIASTMSVLDPNLAKLVSEGFRLETNSCSFVYSDPDLCEITGTVILTRDLLNPNTLNYKYKYLETWINKNCQFYGNPNGIPIPIPTQSLTLTKVN